MATYPGGVFAPSLKTNGQSITPDLFNTPDAEITAIEDALKNGIAHAVTISTGGLTVSTGSVNIGGPSTLATLQVLGGSTFAGPVRMSSAVTLGGGLTVSSGGATITGGLTVDGVALAGPTTKLCEVTHGSSQTVAAGAWTGLSWNTETLDVGALHSTASNSSRIFLTSSGSWLVGLSLEWKPNSSGARKIQILLNDTTAQASQMLAPVAAVPVPMTLQTYVRAQSTSDWVTARAWTNDNNGAIATASTTGLRFWALYQGA